MSFGHFILTNFFLGNPQSNPTKPETRGFAQTHPLTERVDVLPHPNWSILYGSDLGFGQN